jgi:hypothetical protein
MDFISRLPALGLNLPLKQASSEQGGGLLGSEPISPAADSIGPQKGPSCFAVVALVLFLAKQRKERPRRGARSKINVPKALKKTIAM